MEKKCYFFDLYSTKTFYIRIPKLCHFDNKNCNGNCKKLSFNVNHSKRLYCFKINCNDITCNKNHLLDWCSNSKQIDHISISEFANEIYLAMGQDNILKILCDNYKFIGKSENSKLFYELERLNQKNENISLFMNDLRHEELKLIVKRKKEYQQQLYLKRLSMLRIKAHFTIFNEYNYDLDNIKLKVKNKESIIEIIKSFLGYSKLTNNEYKKISNLLRLKLIKHFDNNILNTIRKFIDTNELFF